MKMKQGNDVIKYPCCAVLCCAVGGVCSNLSRRKRKLVILHSLLSHMNTNMNALLSIPSISSSSSSFYDYVYYLF
jgi:hypothetical protein